MNSTLDSEPMSSHEKRARQFDRWITVAVFVMLLIPLPFARFEAWPEKRIISEHLIMPWSSFRICYLDYPGRESVEDVYEFTWRGEVIPKSASAPHLFVINSFGPLMLKWQQSREVILNDIYIRGEFLKMETFWQPVIVWPFKMAWRVAPRK